MIKGRKIKWEKTRGGDWLGKVGGVAEYYAYCEARGCWNWSYESINDDQGDNTAKTLRDAKIACQEHWNEIVRGLINNDEAKERRAAMAKEARQSPPKRVRSIYPK